MQASADKAVAVLTNKLVGSFITRFSVGDTWDLYFGDCWLLAHDIIPEDEALISQFLAANTSWYGSAVDKEYSSKSAFVAACMRKLVREASLDKLCNLLLTFEDGSKLTISANVDIVDWQWSLSETDAIPYVDYLVACFWTGEIEVSEE